MALIDQEQRRRAKKTRGERKERVKQAARTTFLKRPYPDITLENIGGRAKVEGGIVSMFYGSREELFLVILQDEMEAWLDELDERLPRIRAVKGAAKALGDLLGERADLARLLGTLPTVMEIGGGTDGAVRFGRWHSERVGATGAHLARRLDGLSRDGAARVLLRLQLIAGGLFPGLASASGLAGAGPVDLPAELTLLAGCLLAAEIDSEVARP